jgi:hypothetical protein
MCLCSYKNVNLTNVELLGLESISFSWIMTPEIHPGQLIVVVGESAFYTLDSQHRPFQIAGTRDLLLDVDTYVDLTENYQNVLSDVQHILLHAFSALSLQEMNSCAYLKEWEWEIKERVIRNKMTFSEIKSTCVQSLLDLPNENISSKIRKALSEVKKSRKKIEFYIDWGDYNITSQKLKIATD